MMSGYLVPLLLLPVLCNTALFLYLVTFTTTATVLSQLVTLPLLQSAFVVNSPFITTGLLLIYTKWLCLCSRHSLAVA